MFNLKKTNSILIDGLMAGDRVINYTDSLEIECRGCEQLVATVSFVAKSESSMKKMGNLAYNYTAGWFKSAEKKREGDEFDV